MTSHAVHPVAVVVESAAAAEPAVIKRAETLAGELGVSLAGFWPASDQMPLPPLVLVVGQRRIGLQETAVEAAGPVYVDFLHGAEGHRRTSLAGRQPLARAVGRGARTVVDATAGLARDAFQLACLGYHVTAIERSTVLVALVSDGIARAREHGSPELLDALDRLTLCVGDARDVLACLPEETRPDVVYLDPMYPPARKSLPKKEMRICRLLVGDDADAAELLAKARRVAIQRVLVKRHPHTESLATDTVASVLGKQVRYDIYGPLP